MTRSARAAAEACLAIEHHDLEAAASAERLPKGFRADVRVRSHLNERLACTCRIGPRGIRCALHEGQREGRPLAVSPASAVQPRREAPAFGGAARRAMMYGSSA